MKKQFILIILALVICVTPAFAEISDENIERIEEVYDDGGIEIPEAEVVVTIPEEEETSEPEEENKRSGFLTQEEIKEQIEEYYKNYAPHRMIIRLYLLEITEGNTNKPLWDDREGYREQTSVNERWVYFMEGRSPSTAKDFYGNIDSRKEKIMLAKFGYDYLKNTWRISSIERFNGKKIFKVDE